MTSRSSGHVRRVRERDVLAACLEYLRLEPKVAWSVRMNTGAVRMGEAERYVKFGFPGCPDIIGQMADGRFLAVECKGPRGRPSVLQRSFLEKVKASHGVGCLVYSVSDLEWCIRKS